MDLAAFVFVQRSDVDRSFHTLYHTTLSITFREFALGNRSALDWVIDQYLISEDKRSGIVSDPNNLDDEEYIVRLVGKVITVSVETVRLVNELAQVVKMEDWMSEIV